ncbi:MAG: hypothetical protein WHV66_11180 [Anaerolineales bacterium]|jgi:hypothetical protein
MPSVIIHIQNEDPVLGEIDELPSPGDSLIIVKNPRKRDGKDLIYLDPNVNTVIWPVIRINFIEVVPSEAEEEIITFVRE